jgi:MFS transporter, PAT family, beta-lactamase induction signal transducer AmpG
MADEKKAYRNPWSYIPTLYFAEGVPYVIVNTVSVAFYKTMGVDNGTLAFATSWLYLFWTLKMFWGLLVETHSTKRNWILYTELAMTFCFALLGMVLHLASFFYVSLFIFFIAAFISATHDIAADGFYLIALNKEDQAGFVGIRSTFYRMAMIFGQGFLIWLAGYLAAQNKDVPLSWSIAFLVATVVFALIFVVNKYTLPTPADDTPRKRDKNAFKDGFLSYFKQKNIGIILAFIFLYRFGEGFLIKMNIPFYLDKVEQGGLGLTTAQVGIIYGTIGVLSLLAGGVIGGIIIKKYGLKKCIWPMVIIINIPMYVYIFMSRFQPGAYVASGFIAFEQFSYGFGFTAYSVFLMYVSGKSSYKTTYYAISTSLMALGMMVPGLVAGYLQKYLGYPNFFIMTAIVGIPGLLTVFFIPTEDEDEAESKKTAE